MLRLAKLAIAASVTATAALPALAADFRLPHLPPEPPRYAPEPVPEPPPIVSGWYLRGDISYDVFKRPKITFNEVVHEVEFTDAKIDDTWNIGFGFGHQFNDWFRADLTFDYHHKTKFTGRTDGECPDGISHCFSRDTADLTLFTTMANIYADLGYFHGITPYVGAGAGLAYVDWSNAQSDAFCADFCPGFEEFTLTWWSNSQWRFAWALMAGLSMDLTEQLALDAGYRFLSINGGNMIRDNDILNGPVRFKNLRKHEARVGLRYTFGDAFIPDLPPPVVAKY